jgi:hypothetical protein
MKKDDQKELKSMGKKGFIKNEKADIKTAKGYGSPKKMGKKK